MIRAPVLMHGKLSKIYHEGYEPAPQIAERLEATAILHSS